MALDAGPRLPRSSLNDCWVVVPCYNEAAVLHRTLTQLTAVFPRVTCVDDASTDGSAAIAASVDAVRLLRHPVNLGQGAALQTGISDALRNQAMRRLVTFDADGQHLVADAVAMADRLGQIGPDGRELAVILGTRFGGPPVAGIGRLRRALLRAAVAYTRASVHLKVTDTHNGLRALTRPVAAKLELHQGGMAHASEILEQIAAYNWAWAEHPVTINYTAYSRSKGQSSLNAVNVLVDLLMRPRK